MDLHNSDIFLEDVESRNGQPSGEDQPQRSFLDIVLDIALRHRRALGRLALAALVLATATAFLIPTRYTSTTRIMPPEGPNPAALLAAVSGKMPAGIGELAGGFLGVKNSGPLWVDLLESRTVLDNQVDHFDLLRVYWTKKRYKARKKLVSRTDISEDRKSGVISISVEDTSPQRAKELADGYVNQLNQLLASVSTSSARRERIFIEQRLNSAKKDLEDAEIEFGKFAATNSTFDLKEQTKAIVGAGAQLQGQIIAAQSELEGLEQTYTDENIRVRSVKARIASLKREMAKLGGTGEETTVSLAPGDISPPIRQLPIVGVKWADLYRRAKIQETVFDLLTQQYEIAKIQEAKETPTVRVIDAADYPERKSWPPRLAIIIASVLLACGLGIGWFKIREDWGQLPEGDSRKQTAAKVASLFRSHNQPSQTPSN